MENQHLSRHPLDDEISERAMNTFLETFDLRKMYFYQSDVDAFHRKLKSLDDDVKAQDISFAYEVLRVFLQRVDERLALVEELLQGDFDFTVDEELVTDPDLLGFPKDTAEARERWRRFLKYNLLVAKSDGEELEEAKKKIQRRYQLRQRRWHQIDDDELLERFLTSITSAYDPHTTFMSKSSLENFRIMMRLNLEGIGAALQMSEDGYTVVSKVIPDGAADKHGKLKPEDRIVSVGQGKDGEMVDVMDMKLNDVVKLIRGPAGTTVRLGVRPGGTGETQIYTISRAKIELADSAARSEVIERGQRPDGKPFRIGVIDLPSFYMDMEAARDGRRRADFRSTTRDVRRILDEFTSQNIDAVVVDLRSNGGGSLTEAINVTGLFIDEGPVVQVKDSDGNVHPYDDLDRGMAWRGPLVVLVSKFSASASEIFAGAIQDYRRGLIIGDEATHGKGTVQSLLDLGSELFRIPNPPNLGALKITMQQFYRPNGDSTQVRGVVPDIVLPSLTNHIGIAESDLDYAIKFDRVQKARYPRYEMVPPEALARMRAQSEARIRGSEEFADLGEDIARYQQIKEEKRIPLNEEKFLARRDAQRTAEEEEEKQIEEQANPTDEVFEDNFYNNEVLTITLDYLTELSRNSVARSN
jgi:carboxyl-terminal processing protease